MDLNNRIDTLVALGKELENIPDKKLNEAYLHNKWFVVDNIKKSLAAIKDNFLDKEKLEDWISKYQVADINTNKKIGIIMAGNIPLVGFHDLLCVFITGHTAIIKLSSKDEILMKHIFKLFYKINPKTKDLIIKKERLKNIDAIIATGSNNSYRYFEYYFGKLPNIIRKNRNGVAVLTGNENEEDLVNLSYDVFDYFGLGCRNISKIYVPEKYNFDSFIPILDRHQYLKEHNKYMNNYDYNLAIAMLNKDKIYQGEVFFLKEDISYLSRISNLHYEEYSDLEQLKRRISNDEELIQVTATKTGVLLDFDREVCFGDTQKPSLDDYSDGIDIMEFLTEL